MGFKQIKSPGVWEEFGRAVFVIALWPLEGFDDISVSDLEGFLFSFFLLVFDQVSDLDPVDAGLVIKLVGVDGSHVTLVHGDLATVCWPGVRWAG